MPRQKYRHFLIFEGMPDCVQECARYAGTKIEPTHNARVEKPKGYLVKAWVSMNTIRAKSFGVLTQYRREKQ